MEKEITSLMEKACVEILKKVVETGSISDNELLLITTYTKATQKKATKNDLQKLLGLGKEVASVIEKIFYLASFNHTAIFDSPRFANV